MPQRDGSLRVLLFGPPTSHLEHAASVIRDLGHEVILVSYDTHHPGAFAHLPLIEGNRRVVTLWQLFRARAAFRAIIRSTRPDIVHAHWLTGPGWIAALAGAQPLVVSAWGSDALRWTPTSRLARALMRVVAQKAQTITYDADEVRVALERLGVPPARLERIVFGIERRFQPGPGRPDLLERLGATTGQPVVLAPRGLDAVYRPETVVGAFIRVAANRRSTLLLRVAPGQQHLLEDLEREFGDLRASSVVAYESVDPADLPALLRSATVVVSVPESDGSSVLLLQAIACETPVVVSDLPANREWVTDELAPLVPVGDAVALADAIERILADPTRARTAMRELAVPVRQRASIEAERSELSLIYRTLTGAAATRRLRNSSTIA